ncbi:MAG: peptide-methionine (S)-S-oxide reductase MsrA [Bryobacterales bacterium]|nr:peptide-methionine (S)-S-oxide reductase MsrA [Bryobacterales bacterium]
MAALEVATFGGGCFWCIEAVFSRLQGVESAEPGYAGGTAPAPTYEQVCTDTTGHAEAVQVRFDPERISYQDLLEVFFSVHDPTTLNRQGPDVGAQYRSVIFCHTAEQEHAARQMIRELDRSGAYRWPIVTEVVPASRFYRAEEYHQGYFRRNPEQPYCSAVIAPKYRKFCEKFAARLKNG